MFEGVQSWNQYCQVSYLYSECQWESNFGWLSLLIFEFRKHEQCTHFNIFFSLSFFLSFSLFVFSFLICIYLSRLRRNVYAILLFIPMSESCNKRLFSDFFSKSRVSVAPFDALRKKREWNSLMNSVMERQLRKNNQYEYIMIEFKWHQS